MPSVAGQAPNGRRKGSQNGSRTKTGKQLLEVRTDVSKHAQGPGQKEGKPILFCAGKNIILKAGCYKHHREFVWAPSFSAIQRSSSPVLSYKTDEPWRETCFCRLLLALCRVESSRFSLALSPVRA